MIQTEILAKYLPYKLRFKIQNNDAVYYMYCLSVDGSIVLKNIEDDSDTHVIHESNVGSIAKPILIRASTTVKAYYKQFNREAIDPEIFKQYYDVFDLIDQEKAIEII